MFNFFGKKNLHDDDDKTKKQKLINLFCSGIDRLEIIYVLDETGIASKQSLKQHISNLKRDGILYLRTKWGFVEVVK